MTNATKQYVLAALSRATGDDMERAERAFAGLDTITMQSKFGQSGMTRQQILDGYRAERECNIAAIKEIEAL